jgi:hypothetical protein
VGDPYNNPGQDSDLLRFSVWSGEPAIVTIIRDNGFTSQVETDDSSNFDLYLSAGSHIATVETGYTYPPDTFYNIQLKPGDTSLTLDIEYDVLDPLNIDFVYSYPTMDDTLGAAFERNVFSQLNRHAKIIGKPLMLDILVWMPVDTFRFEIYESYWGTVYITHRVPIRREYHGYGKLYNVLEVYEKLYEAAKADTTGLIPPGFSFYPAGGYICSGSPRGGTHSLFLISNRWR